MSSRYQIWDGESDVITPSMKIFSAEEWKEKYPIAKIEGVKIVLASGLINGAFCGEFTTMVDQYKREGCDFSGCVTDQDYLDRIEEFEDTPPEPVNYVTTDERIAAALEAQVLMALPDEEA